jgi:cytochrome c oxidase cbb3-type subunit IV
METYTLMREIADSWVMLAMFSIFIGVVVWAFRPGSRPVHDDIANSIFRHEKKPAAEAVSTPAARQQTEEA